MAIRAVNFQPLPYVGRGNLGDLLGLRGQQTGQMWAQLGQTIAGGLNQYAQQRAQAPILAQQAEARAIELDNAKAQQSAMQQASKRAQALDAFVASPEFEALPETEKRRGFERIAGPREGSKAFQEWFAGVQAPLEAEAKAAATVRAAELANRDYRMKLNAAGVSEMDRLEKNALTQQTAKDVSADRTADNARLDAAAKETERHNRAQERAAWAAASRTSANEPLEKIVGPDGKVVFVPRSQAIGKTPGAGTEKSSSGVQKRVLNFFNRAEQADKDLEALEPEIEKLGLARQARQALAPNFLQSQLGQSYIAAQRAFTEARLRKDSGAAIPKEEFESDRKTYFVQPGDSKQTIQDKNRARAAMLASLAFESGQALGEFVGDADEAKKIIEGYKARSAKSGGPTLGAVVTVNGQRVRVTKINANGTYEGVPVP